jgi:hypothetical protein
MEFQSKCRNANNAEKHFGGKVRRDGTLKIKIHSSTEEEMEVPKPGPLASSLLWRRAPHSPQPSTVLYIDTEYVITDNSLGFKRMYF